jgi:hypothetical protein
MNIFLSYSSDRRNIAEQVSLALTGSGHKVFFDRDTLPAGDDYHVRIRKGVEQRHLCIPHQSESGSARQLRADRTKVCAAKMA